MNGDKQSSTSFWGKASCNCDCASDLPVQFAEPDPDPEFGFDWVDWLIVGGTLAVFFVIGFGLGRAWS